MSTAIAIPNQQALAMRNELDVVDVIAQVKKIHLVMEQVMKEGEHYGVIPGTNKPTLLKPGAEKLLLTFRFDPQYESTETYEGKHLTVKSKCTLYHIPTGMRMGSGEGSCSTKESKYAYRKGQRECPACGKPVRKSKFPPRGYPRTDPGGWYCPANDGGCGAEFAHDNDDIVSQIVGRIPNDDLADSYNTVLKMANKRGLVAAVLNVTAASDIFTQDLEDNHDDDRKPARPAESKPISSHDGQPKPAEAREQSQAELVEESERLFPAPDVDRDPLIQRIKKFTDAKVRLVRRRLELGDGGHDGLERIDMAALDMLVKHLELAQK